MLFLKDCSDEHVRRNIATKVRQRAGAEPRGSQALRVACCWRGTWSALAVHYATQAPSCNAG